MNSVSDLNRARNTNLKNVVKLNKIETIKYSCTLKKNFAVWSVFAWVVHEYIQEDYS